MNQRVIVALLTFVTGSLALPAHESGRHEPNEQRGIGNFIRLFQCNKAISMNKEEFLWWLDAKAYCIAEMFNPSEGTDSITFVGLGADRLAAERSSNYSRTSEEGRKIGGGNLKDMTPLGREEDTDISLILETRGFQEEAYYLRMCIAYEMDMISCGSYNQGKLEGWIMDKVAGLTIESNTQAGVMYCDDVEDYNVDEYLNCVKAYCVSGGGPDGPGK